ncbi:MAG: hypothetical protein IKF96_07580, partial [Eggerthellaceae bacterium]|nr:hypothetical protein [Eggerthellaceae bacterium]
GTQPGMAGIYPWSLAAYVEAASLLRPSWWSAPDLCNEMQVAANPDEVRHRINVTATLLEGTLQIIYEWQNELARTCNSTVVQDLVRPPVPIIQGWTRDSYLYSLDLTNERDFPVPGVLRSCGVRHPGATIGRSISHQLTRLLEGEDHDCHCHHRNRSGKECLCCAWR